MGHMSQPIETAYTGDCRRADQPGGMDMVLIRLRQRKLYHSQHLVADWNRRPMSNAATHSQSVAENRVGHIAVRRRLARFARCLLRGATSVWRRWWSLIRLRGIEMTVEIDFMLRDNSPNNIERPHSGLEAGDVRMVNDNNHLHRSQKRGSFKGS